MKNTNYTKFLREIQKNFWKYRGNFYIYNFIGKIKNKALDSFGLYKELNKNNKELNDFIEGYEYVLPDEEDKMMKDLYNTNIEIKALLKFYNKNVELYNKIISKFSRLLLRIIKRYSKKEVFEIEDEVEFEILKEKNWW